MHVYISRFSGKNVLCMIKPPMPHFTDTLGAQQLFQSHIQRHFLKRNVLVLLINALNFFYGPNSNGEYGLVCWTYFKPLCAPMAIQFGVVHTCINRPMMTSPNENISALLALCVRGIHRSPVDSPHKGHWHGALMFSLICAWTNGWANNWDSGDLWRHHAHYYVIVMPSDWFRRSVFLENENSERPCFMHICITRPWWINSSSSNFIARTHGCVLVCSTPLLARRHGTWNSLGVCEMTVKRTRLCYWIARPAKPGVQSSNTSRVRFTVISHTHVFSLLSHTHIMYKRNWDDFCLVNLIYFGLHIFQIRNLLCIALMNLGETCHLKIRDFVTVWRTMPLLCCWPAHRAGLLCCNFFDMLTPVPYHHFFSSLILLFIYV